MNHLEGRLVVPFEALRMTDVDSVGGKNASLGEMINGSYRRQGARRLRHHGHAFRIHP